MRIFVTGASGWIGSAVVPELLGAGHQVVGLARSDASAAALVAAGAEVQPGTLDDLDDLRRAADASDGVIHLAFKHDLAFSGDFEAAADADRRAVEAFGETLAGTDRPFVLASGLLGLTPGRVATEQDGHVADDGSSHMPAGPRTRPGTAQLCRPSHPGACGPRYCACPPPSTATATTASSPPSSASPGPRARPATSATAPTAGPPCTARRRPSVPSGRRAGAGRIHPARRRRRGRGHPVAWPR